MANQARLTIDLSGLEKHFKLLEGGTLTRIHAAVRDLAGDAKESAIDLINLQIYDTPARGNYVRTGALRSSIHAEAERSGATRWSIVIGAVGGAGGRKYALFNERGTWGSRVTLESIRARAEAAKTHQGLIRLQYGDPKSGLEPRPWITPTIVMIAFYFPELVLTAIREAEAQASA